MSNEDETVEPQSFRPADVHDYYREQWERITEGATPEDTAVAGAFRIQIQGPSSSRTNWLNISEDLAQRILERLSVQEQKIE